MITEIIFYVFNIIFDNILLYDNIIIQINKTQLFMKNFMILLSVLYFLIVTQSFAQESKTVSLIEISNDVSIKLPKKNDYKGREKRIFKKIIVCIEHIIICTEYLPKLESEKNGAEKILSAEKGIQENYNLLEEYKQKLNLSNKQMKLLFINHQIKQDYGIPLI